MQGVCVHHHPHGCGIASHGWLERHADRAQGVLHADRAQGVLHANHAQCVLEADRAQGVLHACYTPTKPWNANWWMVVTWTF